MSEIDVNSPTYEIAWKRARVALEKELPRLLIRYETPEDLEAALDIAANNILKAVLTKPEKR